MRYQKDSRKYHSQCVSNQNEFSPKCDWKAMTVCLHCADVVTLHTGHWAGLWLVSSGGAGLWLAGRGLVTYRPRDNITTLISRHNCHEHRCHSAWRGPATLPQTEHSHISSSTFMLFAKKDPRSYHQYMIYQYCHRKHYAFECFLNLNSSYEYGFVTPWLLVFNSLCLVSEVVAELISYVLVSALELNWYLLSPV